VPPEERFVVRFGAEPPQETLPSGRWAETLRGELMSACLGFDEDVGEINEIDWHPDRTWAGRTYVPATARTSSGLDVFGYVAYSPADDDHPEPADFTAFADFTDETAEANPEWKLDLCDEVIGGWRGEHGRVAALTLVWGRALTGGGAIVTAELAGIAVDQCALADQRFTLIAADNYKGDFLEVHLWDSRGGELASESLYDDDGD
jgi:hypothetical protein